MREISPVASLLSKGRERVHGRTRPATEDYEATPNPRSHRAILNRPAKIQKQCRLLTRLPVEIRMLVYSLVLQEYCLADDEHRWSRTSIYWRPGLTGPRRMDCALLRTCRAIYAETWHLPNRMREQVFILFPAATWESVHCRYIGFEPIEDESLLCPPRLDNYVSSRFLLHTIRRIKAMHGVRKSTGVCRDIGLEEDDDGDNDKDDAAALQRTLEIEHLQVFASVPGLEAQLLLSVLGTANFHPRRVTVTIRHLDWCGWETDSPLCIRAGWLLALHGQLSSSTCEVVVQLETVVRKREQVDYIATHISRHWFFRRRDGVALFADATEGSNTVDKWTRSSIFDGRRWTRDESAPNEMALHLVSVPFREPRAMRTGAKISDEARSQTFDLSRMGVVAPGEAIGLSRYEASQGVDWDELDHPGLTEEQRPRTLYRCGNGIRPLSRYIKHQEWDRW